MWNKMFHYFKIMFWINLVPEHFLYFLFLSTTENNIKHCLQDHGHLQWHALIKIS